MTLTHTVTASEDGVMVKYILRQALHVSAALLRRAKASGRIALNGEEVNVTVRVSTGDVLTLEAEDEPSALTAEDGPLEVLYEDGLLLAVNKPEGMFTHPTGNVNTGTLLNLALLRAPGARAVNRLDRDTSGVVLFAKNSWAASMAASLEYEKEYIALVYGVPEPPEGEISLPIAREAPHALRRVVSPEGSASHTLYAVERELEGRSLLRLRPVTGRTHQLRVHCLALGCPILGDGLYKTRESAELSAALGINTQALHARRLSFTHPLTGERISIFAEPGRYFLKT